MFLSVQVLAPGLRLAWAPAAPAPLVKLIYHLQGSNLELYALAKPTPCSGQQNAQHQMSCSFLVQVLAPGLRLGWATAAPALLEKLIFHLHGSTLGPCALSQVVIASLLQHWGPQGFEQHVKDMQMGYARRANTLHKAAGKSFSAHL